MVEVVLKGRESADYESQTTALKRLASAVQLRPWPPCFQSLTFARQSQPVPICSKKSKAGPTGFACSVDVCLHDANSSGDFLIFGEPK